MPDVAVFVPSYDHSRFIERTLRSIFGQTVRPRELLVIDDGSGDGSAEIIERVLRDCPFPNRLIVHENRGVSATLNEGLSLTDSDYFAYLGSDDIWLPNFLEEQVALLESRPEAVLAFSNCYVIDADDNIIDRSENWTDFPDGNFLPSLLVGEIFPSPSVVYRRPPLERVGWNEDAELEDYELYLNLSFEGEFARNKKVLCAWRHHGANTSSNFPTMFKDQLAAQDRAFEKLGMPRDEFDRMQRRMRFLAAANCVRTGHTREAWSLFVHDLAGAPSFTEAVKMLLRLATPRSIFEWNRRRKRRNATRQCGRLSLDN